MTVSNTRSPRLTWRDVQHLISWTSNFEPMVNSPGWRRNAIGLVYNDRFGFGMLNAAELINRAKTWRTVPPMHTCTINFNGYANSRRIMQSGNQFATNKLVFQQISNLHRRFETEGDSL